MLNSGLKCVDTFVLLWKIFFLPLSWRTALWGRRDAWSSPVLCSTCPGRPRFGSALACGTAPCWRSAHPARSAQTFPRATSSLFRDCWIYLFCNCRTIPTLWMFVSKFVPHWSSSRINQPSRWTLTICLYVLMVTTTTLLIPEVLAQINFGCLYHFL